jgi:hypothetical protein
LPGRRDNAFVKLAGVPNNAQLFAAATAYDTVEQISTIFYGTNVSLRRNNGSPIQAASSAAFNGTRIALGFAGNSTFRSPPGSYVAEWWFFSTALSAADRESCMPTKRPSSACHSGHRLVI